MDKCPGCAQFEPMFYQLSQQVNGLQFAVVNLTHNRKVVAYSRQTNTPIGAVPYILLYVNGRPYAIFKGKKNIPTLRSFIQKALSNAPPPTPQSSFAPQPNYHPGPPAGQHGPPPQQQGNGMYGNGGYAHPQIAPSGQNSHAGYQPNGPPSNGKVWMPDVKAPNVANSLRGGKSKYAYLNDVEEEDETKLQLPSEITPYNTPWDTKYKKMELYE